jgi:hypothetical protein
MKKTASDKHPVLESERIYLRPLCSQDVEIIYGKTVPHFYHSLIQLSITASRLN